MVFVIAIDAGADFFAWQAKGHEDHPTIDARHAGAEVGEGVDLQFQLVMIRKGIGVEFFRRSHITNEP